MSALLDAVRDGGLKRIQRLIAEGADVQERDPTGFTPFLWAAYNGNMPIMHWLLTEGGSSLAERTVTSGASALLLAASSARFRAVQYLLEQGALMTERDSLGRTVWSELLSVYRDGNTAEISSLLKVMVLLDDTPANFFARLSPQHAELCTRGQQLRAQLSSYLEQQRATVVAHCLLPNVLRSLVATYAATTPGDMWVDGLRL
jgi:ankyrin repeat protein